MYYNRGGERCIFFPSVHQEITVEVSTRFAGHVVQHACPWSLDTLANFGWQYWLLVHRKLRWTRIGTHFTERSVRFEIEPYCISPTRRNHGKGNFNEMKFFLRSTKSGSLFVTEKCFWCRNGNEQKVQFIRKVSQKQQAFWKSYFTISGSATSPQAVKEMCSMLRWNESTKHSILNSVSTTQAGELSRIILS